MQVRSRLQEPKVVIEKDAITVCVSGEAVADDGMSVCVVVLCIGELSSPHGCSKRPKIQPTSSG